MPEDFFLHYFDASSSSKDHLQTLKRLFENDPWVILSEWPDPSSGPNFNIKVGFVGSPSSNEISSPSVSFLTRLLSSQNASQATLAAVENLLSSVSPLLRDGTISNLSLTLPNNHTILMDSHPKPFFTFNYEYAVPIDTTEAHIAALELLQNLEYSFDLRIKLASIDDKGQYVGDASEEYESFLVGLPQDWRVDPDDFHIQTRFAGTRQAWHLRHNDLDVAVVEHETGVEFLLGIAAGLVTSGLYDLIKWSIKKWGEKRQLNQFKSPTFLEIERVQRGPDGSLLGSEVTRVRAPIEEARLKSILEGVLQSTTADRLP